MWEESKAQGGFMRLLVWCGATQSAIGFSSVFVILLLGGTSWFAMQDPENAENVRYMWEVGMSFWYIAIIFPALGTGIIITLHSWREALRRRDFSSGAVAAWNTYAQASNTIGAVQNMGGAFSKVGEGLGSLFSGKGDAKGKLALLAILIVIVALMLGVLVTALLIQHYARTAPALALGRQSSPA